MSKVLRITVLLLWGTVVIFMSGCLTMTTLAGLSSGPDTFLASSQSPNGEYVLEAYRTEPGATVDFSVRVYLVKDSKKSLVYDVYHERDVVIEWMTNSVVTINDKTIDLSLDEKYISSPYGGH